MFTVTIDALHHRVELKIVGNVTDEEAGALTDAIRQAAITAKGKRGSFVLLADMRDAAVLTQSVARMAEANTAWCIANGMTKTAAVSGSMIAKMQGERINHVVEYGQFQSRDEAIAWLEAD